MAHIWSLTKKELRTYFHSPIAYVVIVVFLVVSGWLFFRAFFLEGQVSLRGYFLLLPWLFLFFVPAITMRLFAEEKKLKTLEMLLTWPVRDVEVVLGKFLASLLFIIIVLLLSLSIPFSLRTLGNLDMGGVAAGYIGSIFLAAAYLSIGIWISSLTSNQIVAFILTVVASFMLFIVGEDIVLFVIPQGLVPFFDFIGLGTHFESIMRGVVDSRDVLYYLSVIIFFLFLNMRELEKRHR